MGARGDITGLSVDDSNSLGLGVGESVVEGKVGKPVRVTTLDKGFGLGLDSATSSWATDGEEDGSLVGLKVGDGTDAPDADDGGMVGVLDTGADDTGALETGDVVCSLERDVPVQERLESLRSKHAHCAGERV